MSKRTRSAQIDHLAKRQRSTVDLMAEADRNATDGNPGHAGQRPNHEQTEAAPQMIQQVEGNTCSPAQSETRHPTTPIDSPFSSSRRNSLEIQTLAGRFASMKVRDADHSVSDFTNCRPGQMPTEARYARIFTTPPYGRHEHRYYLPIDEEEEQRSEIGHICWLKTTKLLYARAEPGIILDLGTGDGRWVQDVAKMKPHCRVIGVDQYYSDLLETPHQADFEVDDCELDFAERDEPVTFVNLRDSFLWVRDPKMLMKRIYKALRPGGWFQNQEIRLSAWDSNKPHVRRWRDEVLASARKLGIRLFSATEMGEAMAEAGFVEYQSEILTWTSEELRDLREYALSTVKASVGILYDAWGESTDLKGIVNAAIGDLKAHDCDIEIGVEMCWAKKSGA